MAAFRRFLKTWAVGTAAAVALVAASTLLVDPYGIWRFATVDGFNAAKPRIGPLVRLVKPYQVQRARPRTIILGNSRSEVGLDPDQMSWSDARRPIYNLSIPGSGLYLQYRLLQHAASVADPEQLILGIDFIHFLNDANDLHSHYEIAFEESDLAHRLAVDRSGEPTSNRWRQQVVDMTTTVLSLSAFFDSLLTVFLQNSPDVPTITEAGFNPMNEYRKFARIEGYAGLFEQKNLDYFKDFGKGGKSVFVDGSNWSHDFEHLRMIIDYCRENDIALTLYIHPYHVQLLEMFRIAGHWNDFESWKRRIVELLATEAAEEPERLAFPLWDFSVYDHRTMEAVPPPGDRGIPMQWYWESSHYKRALGDAIIARLFGDVGADDTFGTLLTEANVEAHLQRQRAAQQHYARENPEVIATLRAGISRAAKGG